MRYELQLTYATVTLLISSLLPGHESCRCQEVKQQQDSLDTPLVRLYVSLFLFSSHSFLFFLQHHQKSTPLSVQTTLRHLTQL